VSRPKRTRKDSNHAELRDDLRGDGYTVIDVADLPGDPRHNPLDLFVMRPRENPPVIVATSAAGVRRWFAEHPGEKWVQVEIKPAVDSRFTEDEEAYLRWLGIWPAWMWL
jgi:hypothetical protein